MMTRSTTLLLIAMLFGAVMPAGTSRALAQTLRAGASAVDVSPRQFPVSLRSGKAMSCRTTQIVIQFREPPFMLFEDGPRHPLDANRLVIQIQPAEGIQLHFHTKVPDAGMKLRITDLDFNVER